MSRGVTVLPSLLGFTYGGLLKLNPHTSGGTEQSSCTAAGILANLLQAIGQNGQTGGFLWRQ